MTVVAWETVKVYVDTPALPVRVIVTVPLATTSEAVYVLVRTLVSAPEPTVTKTVEIIGAAVVDGVWIAADVEIVEVRIWLPSVTVITVSTGIEDVTVS